MNQDFFGQMTPREREGWLTPEEKIRLAAIEGRPDLFETRVLRVRATAEPRERINILVATRDPGSGNALLPVMRKLVEDPRVQMDVVSDGRAQEIVQNNFETENITPKGMVLEADNVIGTPRVILIDPSSERGIDFYAAATFPEVPKVLVEDYYGTAIIFLSELKRTGCSPLPEKICVMDEAAKKMIVRRFPDLEERIEVTGQPAFDRFAEEDTKEIAREVKGKLGLRETDKLVSFMSTMDEPEKIRQMAEALKGIAGDFYLVFRRHPRDNVSYETYKKILTDAGIRVIDTDEFSTTEVGAASDVVLTTWSTEGLHGIYRRKPTVHITDRNFRIPEGLELPLPPVKSEASVGINEVGEIAQILPQLLDPNSALNKRLRKKMEEQYPADGQNAERVSKIVRQFYE